MDCGFCEAEAEFMARKIVATKGNAEAYRLYVSRIAA